MSRKQTTFAALYAVLKNELKSRGITYRDVATALETTQSSIKMRFVHRNLSIVQLVAICELLGMPLTELMRKVEYPDVYQFTFEQEIALTGDLRLALVLVKVLDDLSLEGIVATYDMTEAQCIKHLLELDRLGLIELLPNNVVRKRLRRGADWVPGGPAHQVLVSQIGDYLMSRFDMPHEKMIFSRADLTMNAISILQADIRQLQDRIDKLHEECKLAPKKDLRRIVLLAAEREWELPAFQSMRRQTKPSETTPG